MAFEITHIRTQSPEETEKQITHVAVITTTVGDKKELPREPRELDITHVKLATGEVQTRTEAAIAIDAGAKYFFKSSDGKEVPVMSLHPQSTEEIFIKTRPGSGSNDKMLILPRF
jgi:hypothetical protein